MRQSRSVGLFKNAVRAMHLVRVTSRVSPCAVSPAYTARVTLLIRVNVCRDMAARIVMSVSIPKDVLFYDFLIFFGYQACPENKWGEDCKEQCQCGNGAACDPMDGTCLCKKGWQGRHCSQECDPNRYGDNCSETCRCLNGGTCDHVSGACKCTKQWMGPL